MELPELILIYCVTEKMLQCDTSLLTSHHFSRLSALLSTSPIQLGQCGQIFALQRNCMTYEDKGPFLWNKKTVLNVFHMELEQVEFSIMRGFDADKSTFVFFVCLSISVEEFSAFLTYGEGATSQQQKRIGELYSTCWLIVQ